MGTTTETLASTDQTVMFPFKTEGLVVQAAKADFILEPITLDEVRSDEVLVEMKFSGICHTVRLFSRPKDQVEYVKLSAKSIGYRSSAGIATTCGVSSYLRA